MDDLAGKDSNVPEAVTPPLKAHVLINKNPLSSTSSRRVSYCGSEDDMHGGFADLETSLRRASISIIPRSPFMSGIDNRRRSTIGPNIHPRPMNSIANIIYRLDSQTFPVDIKPEDLLGMSCRPEDDSMKQKMNCKSHKFQGNIGQLVEIYSFLTVCKNVSEPSHVFFQTHAVFSPIFSGLYIASAFNKSRMSSKISCSVNVQQAMCNSATS